MVLGIPIVVVAHLQQLMDVSSASMLQSCQTLQMDYLTTQGRRNRGGGEGGGGHGVLAPP